MKHNYKALEMGWLIFSTEYDEIRIDASEMKFIYGNDSILEKTSSEYEVYLQWSFRHGTYN